VRVYLDMEKLGKWPEVNSWFLKLKSKKDQDSNLLFGQIKEAGHDIFGIQKVKIEPVNL